VRSRPLLLRYEGRFDGSGYVARGALAQAVVLDRKIRLSADGQSISART